MFLRFLMVKNQFFYCSLFLPFWCMWRHSDVTWKLMVLNLVDMDREGQDLYQHHRSLIRENLHGVVQQPPPPPLGKICYKNSLVRQGLTYVRSAPHGNVKYNNEIYPQSLRLTNMLSISNMFCISLDSTTGIYVISKVIKHVANRMVSCFFLKDMGSCCHISNI